MLYARNFEKRCLWLAQQRFPSATDKELVRLVEAAPGLMRMSGLNGTLDVKVGGNRISNEA